jgi:hypothetical protein
MLTLFSTPKPFLGHIGVIQRNALKSWKLLDANAEVILFGNEEGAAEACEELGLRHEPQVARSTQGAVRADSLFATAQAMAQRELLCYLNCDIVITAEFAGALRRVSAWQSRFLMVGRRWDTEVTEPIDFSAGDWQEKLLAKARKDGIQRFYHNVDYFAFPRGFYTAIPELVVGRVWWDHWMVWQALNSGAAVVDASDVVCAVHQNHDYEHVPQGWDTVAKDEDARRNLVLAGGHAHLRTIEDATFRFTATGIVPNRFAWLAPAKRRWRSAGKAVGGTMRTRVWHPFLDVTRKVRHAMGLKHDKVPAVLRSKERRHWMD